MSHIIIAILVNIPYFLDAKMISRRATRRQIVLHPKQNIKSELKWQTSFGAEQS